MTASKASRRGRQSRISAQATRSAASQRRDQFSRPSQADACRSMYGNGIGAARQPEAPKLLSTSKLHLGH